MTSVSTAEIEELIRRARSGESGALGELLELYRSYVQLIARFQFDRRLRSKLSESDLVQETFLTAKKGISGFSGTSEAEFIAWLRRILVSRLAEKIRHYSTARRNVELEQRLEESMNESSLAMEAQFVASGTSPSVRAARREQAVLLADALASLPADHREVILLRHMEGLSFPEISRQLDRDLDSARSLWRRAIKGLRESLSEEP